MVIKFLTERGAAGGIGKFYAFFLDISKKTFKALEKCLFSHGFSQGFKTLLLL